MSKFKCIDAESIGETFAAGNLNAMWKNTVSNYMKPEVMLALQWCAYVLPKEEDCISHDERAEIMELLARLEDKLDNPELPSGFVRILREHLDQMRQSFALYGIRGTRVLREAVRKAVVDIQLDADEIRSSVQAANPAAQSAATKLVSDFGVVLGKAATAAGDVEKLGSTLGKAVKWTENLLQLASDNLGR